MDGQTVHVTINKDGEVEVKVEGVQGYTCLDITRGLEDYLGNDVVHREMTSEAYEVATEEESTRIYGA